jgi:hypothetical protein
MNLYSHVMPVVQRDAAEPTNGLLDSIAVNATVRSNEPARPGRGGASPN